MPARRVRVARLSHDTWALLAVAGAVLVANLPALLGFFDTNPLDFRSGLTGALTPGWLHGRPVIDPSGGLIVQALGHLAALDLLHLHLPWWNPYQGTGMPLLGETESAALFPPTLLLALSGGQLLEHVLLELIAGVCTYLLLVRVALSRPAALAGAIAFALNGKFAWFSDATVNPLPFLPMLLLGIERAYAAARDDRPGGWRLMAVAGAASVYGGFPEVAYIDALMGVAWVAWRWGCLPRARRRALLTRAALGAGAGTLLAAPMLLAMAQYLSHADLGVHAGTGLGAHHLRLSALPQLLLPYVYGPINADPQATIWIMTGGYLGTALLVLAAVGLCAPGRRGLKLTLAGLGLLVFARMYGVPPGLGHLIGLLPDMSRIEFYRYGTGVLELSVIVLAALGLDDLVRAPARRRWPLIAIAAALGTVVAAALAAGPAVHALSPGHDHTAFQRASVAGGALIALAVAAVALLDRARVRVAAIVALVAIEAVALYAVPELSAPRRATLDLSAVAYLRAHLGDARFATLGPIAPNYGSYFGLASIGVDDFPPQDYADYTRRALDPAIAIAGLRGAGAPSPRTELLRHLAGYRFAATAYVLTATRAPLAQTAGLQLVDRSANARIYRLAGAAPYFAAPGCRVVPHGRDAADVSCARPTTLVRRETWFAGWSGRIDGATVPVRRVDGLFEAVTVPPGAHVVTFAFAPPGMIWALLAFAASCLAMAVPAFRRRGERRD